MVRRATTHRRFPLVEDAEPKECARPNDILIEEIGVHTKKGPDWLAVDALIPQAKDG